MDMPTRPDDGSASNRLFKKLYRVRAPRSLTMSEEEIERYGQRVTGIKQLDKYLANEMVNGRVTPVTMAKLIDDGGCIQFMNKDDAKSIYYDISQHFLNWEFILGTDFNALGPPQEDFEILRNFQNSLEIFSGYFDREDPNRNPLGDLSVLSARSLRRKFKPQRIPLNGLKADSKEDRVVVETIRSYEDLQQINRSR